MTNACVLLLAATACGARSPSAPVVERYRGPIIDIHAHLLDADDQAQLAPKLPAGEEHLLRLDREAGVTRSGLIVMAPKGDLAATRAQNDRVIGIAKAKPTEFFAIASVHPDDGDAALEELARLAATGVRIIKLHPNSQSFDVGSPAVATVVARSAELGLVLLFDNYSPFDANQTGKFSLLAIKNPKARMILAHFGGPKFDEMAVFGIIKDFAWWPKNVWFDLSAVAHTYADSPYEAQLVWVARQVGTDRILFGSDYPVDTPAHAVDDIVRLGFTAEEQRQIFHDNAAALLR